MGMHPASRASKVERRVGLSPCGWRQNVELQDEDTCQVCKDCTRCNAIFRYQILLVGMRAVLQKIGEEAHLPFFNIENP
jgi:hypothetical protein